MASFYLPKAISSFAIQDLLLPAGAKGGKTPARGSEERLFILTKNDRACGTPAGRPKLVTETTYFWQVLGNGSIICQK